MNPLAILGRLGDSVAVPAPPATVPHGAWQRNWRELARKALEEKKVEKKKRKLLTVGRIYAVGGRAVVRFRGTVESEAAVAAVGRQASVFAEGFAKDSRAMMAAARAARPVLEPVHAVEDTLRAQRRVVAELERAFATAEQDALDIQDMADLELIGAYR